MQDGSPSPQDDMLAGRAEAIMSEKTFNRIILVVLAVGLAALVAMAATAAWLVSRTQDDSRLVERTYRVQSHVAKLEALVEQSETARRGYLLFPVARYTASYSMARNELLPLTERAARETADNPVQRENFAVLRARLAAKVAAGDRTIAFVSQGRRDEARALFQLEQLSQPMGEIRSALTKILDEEGRLLLVRGEQERADAGALLGVVIATALLLALLAAGSIEVVRRYGRNLNRSEQAIRRLNEDLENRVRVRTSDLVRANDEIQRFAYIVSHDLRSPLVNVMGFTSELEVSLKPLRGLVDWIKERAPERLPKAVVEAVEMEIPEAIGFIRSSTKKMDSLINAILRLSREGRRTMTPEPLAMGVMMQTLIDSVRHQLDQHDAVAEVEGELPNIVSDRLAIEQVFGNLIDNAAKYLKRGRPGRLTVRGRREGERVIYEVEDNGRGVDPRDHERIFELFRRSGTQDQVGEGIGLAHVRALVYRLGGTITCVSELDQGATFRLSLPKTLISMQGPLA